MQYIFGDNRSSYAMIYTDGADAEAQKRNSLLRFPIVPSESFNTRGFLSFGTNGSGALFFEIKKDKSIPRSCYFTHGFSREGDPAYYSSEQFSKDIFAGFIPQEAFDAVRDGAPCTFTPAADANLLAAAGASAIDPRVLREVVANLYQKNQVLLAIDDENYSDAAVCAVLGQIYTYLTPCLRKATSYLSAIVDTGSAEVMIRIVPKSMLQDVREPYMNVSGVDFVPSADSVFHRLTDFLANETNRAAFFRNYEVLYSGQESVYKKQNAEELFTAIVERDLAKLEKIVDGFLVKHSVQSRSEITKFAEQLTAVYGAQEELQKRFDFTEADILVPAQILEKNSLFLYKTMLFSDIGTAYLTERIRAVCCGSVISEANYSALIDALKTVQTAQEKTDGKVFETYFWQKIAAAPYLQDLYGRLSGYKQLKNAIAKDIADAISSLEPIEPSDRAQLKAQLTVQAGEKVQAHPDKQINITSFIDGKIEETMDKHNEEYISGARGEVRYPNEVVVAALAKIESAIAGNTSAGEIAQMFTEAFRFQDNYRFMIDTLLSQLVLRSYRTGESKTVCTFFKSNCDEARTESVIAKVKQSDLALGLAFTLDVPVNSEKALGKVLNTILQNGAANEKMTSSCAKAFADTVGAAVQRYAGSNTDGVEKKIRVAMDNCEKNSATYRILESVLCFIKNGAPKDAGKGGKSSENLVGFVGLIAIIAIVAAALFATGILKPFIDLRPDTVQTAGDLADGEDGDEDEKETDPEEDKGEATDPVDTSAPETDPTTDPVTDPETEPDTDPVTDPETEPDADPVTDPTEE